MFNFIKAWWSSSKDDEKNKELDEYKIESKATLARLKTELILSNPAVDDKKKHELEIQLRILEKQSNPWGIGRD